MSITKNFEEKGCLFLKSVFDLETIEEFSKEIREFMNNNEIYTHIKKRQDIKEDKFFVNNSFTELNSFQKMQYYYLPVVDNRGSHNRQNDIGMIDIYNVDKLLPNLYKYFSVDLMTNLLKKVTGKSCRLSRVNLQICSNVTNPIPFHIDNYDKSIKITVYLSDIQSNNDGPLVFIEGTHKPNNMNIKTENVKIFLGNKGDILISEQSGMHKKMPQMGTSCGYLVFNFSY
jgi:hypothetical protein